MFKQSPLTQVGRALTKHLEVAGFSNFDELTKVLKSSALINRAASDALKNILRNGVKSVSFAPRLGENVIQYRLPNGYGARWKLNGDWVGFISP